MTYDDWKLASPPECEREESEWPSAEDLPERKRGGIPAGGFCPGCGRVTDGRHIDRELLPEEEDISW